MKKVLVIGAGLFGCCISIELAKVGIDVTLVEKELDIMMGASKHNHNRIHFGFHYPRSKETARQSLDGLVLFLMRFKDSIVSDFPNYYFIEKNSKVTPKQYLSFCDEVGIEYDIAYPKKQLVNTHDIELSLKVLEPIYDYNIVKNNLKQYLSKLKIKQKFNCNVAEENLDEYDFIVNSSYSGINEINRLLKIPLIRTKLQDVIIPIFESKQERVGLTIMDGPYCSIMPKGFDKNKFLLYHVVHSVASQTIDGNLSADYDIEDQIDRIYNESEKYYPFLKNTTRSGFWRTPRVLPINDNDQRLSELYYNKNYPKVVSVLSGKVSTCWTTALKVKKLIQNGAL